MEARKLSNNPNLLVFTALYAAGLWYAMTQLLGERDVGFCGYLLLFFALFVAHVFAHFSWNVIGRRGRDAVKQCVRRWYLSAPALFAAIAAVALGAA